MISIQRGDVVIAELPFIQDFTQTKKRPVLVVQNNTGNHFSLKAFSLAIVRQEGCPCDQRLKAPRFIAVFG